MRVEWRSASTTTGVLSVMTNGDLRRQRWCVDNWAMVTVKVRTSLVRRVYAIILC